MKYNPQEEHFHEVIALHMQENLTWEKLHQKVPRMPRGWFELSRLPCEDRVEFTRVFWQSKLQEEDLDSFFSRVEDIEIFATQSRVDAPFEVHMIYSMEGAEAFFHGIPPADADAFEMLHNQFAGHDFPPDYLAFLQIHDGFSKYTDRGLIPSIHMARSYRQFLQQHEGELLVRFDGEVVNPADLIPFYESAELGIFQCFYRDWYPEGVMGNVFFSAAERSMSNYLDEEGCEANLAFPTFLRWLLYYLEEDGTTG